MKKILSSGNFQIIKRGISLVVVLTMLVVSIVVVAPNLSFGWFAKNQTVTASGMNTIAYHSKFRVYYSIPVCDEQGNYVLDEQDNITYQDFVEITGQDLPIFEGLKTPGDVTQFKIKVVSIGPIPIVMNGFGLEAPNAMEEAARAYDSDGDGVTEAHYLSTEIKTKIIGVTYDETDTVIDYSGGTAETPQTDGYRFLRASASVEAGRVDYFDQLTTKSYILEQGESIVFTVQMAFHNRPDVSQNQFKNFDDYGECSRRLFFAYDEQ